MGKDYGSLGKSGKWRRCRKRQRPRKRPWPRDEPPTGVKPYITLSAKARRLEEVLEMHKEIVGQLSEQDQKIFGGVGEITIELHKGMLDSEIRSQLRRCLQLEAKIPEVPERGSFQDIEYYDR